MSVLKMTIDEASANDRNGAIIALWLFATAMIPIAGLVVQYGWALAMVPLGLPALSLAHAVLVDLLVTYIVAPHIGNKTIGELLERLTFRPAMFALMLYVTSLFL
jgi:hypothetical protein